MRSELLSVHGSECDCGTHQPPRHSRPGQRRRDARRGANLGATLALGTAAAFTLAMAVAALGAEPPSLSTARPVRIQIRWVNNQQAFLAHGNALAMAEDTLLLDRLIMYREPFHFRTDTVRSARVHLPDMDRIEISGGIHGHGRQGALIGGAIGTVLGLAAYASYRSNPYGGGESSNSFAPLLTVVGGGVVGGLLGAGIGALTRTERWERVDRDRLRGLLEGSRRVSRQPRELGIP